MQKRLAAIYNVYEHDKQVNEVKNKKKATSVLV